MKSARESKSGRGRRPAPAPAPEPRGPGAARDLAGRQGPDPDRRLQPAPAARPARPVAREAVQPLGRVAGHAGPGGARPERPDHQRALEDRLRPGRALLRAHHAPAAAAGCRCSAARAPSSSPATTAPSRRGRSSPSTSRGGWSSTSCAWRPAAREGRGPQPGDHREPGGGRGGGRDRGRRARRSSSGAATPSSSRPTWRTCTATARTSETIMYLVMTYADTVG